jgi:hypothetical protein
VHLVQILLPVYGNDGRVFPREEFERTRAELTDRFGGLTTYARAPAEGFWKRTREQPADRDSLVVYEVMTADLDRRWWDAYRHRLEERFQQERVIVRVQQTELL